jgi:hypothetical protein
MGASGHVWLCKINVLCTKNVQTFFHVRELSPGVNTPRSRDITPDTLSLGSICMGLGVDAFALQKPHMC